VQLFLSMIGGEFEEPRCLGLVLRKTPQTIPVVWRKIRKDGGSDGRGVGFYFRNVTELVLFGVRGKNARTLAAGRRQVNMIQTRKREHSHKPDELYPIIEACSPSAGTKASLTPPRV
jgi:N6-adenosine-specific RNA methylase IME4